MGGVTMDIEGEEVLKKGRDFHLVLPAYLPSKKLIANCQFGI